MAACVMCMRCHWDPNIHVWLVDRSNLLTDVLDFFLRRAHGRFLRDTDCWISAPSWSSRPFHVWPTHASVAGKSLSDLGIIGGTVTATFYRKCKFKVIIDRYDDAARRAIIAIATEATTAREFISRLLSSHLLRGRLFAPEDALLEDAHTGERVRADDPRPLADMLGPDRRPAIFEDAGHLPTHFRITLSAPLAPPTPDRVF